MPPAAVALRLAVPRRRGALGRLALRSKGHWGYDEDFLAACRAELTLQPEQCDGAHTVGATLLTDAVDRARALGVSRG